MGTQESTLRTKLCGKGNSAMRLLTIAWALTAALLVWLAWSTYNSYQLAKLTGKRNSRIEHLEGSIILSR